MTAAFDQLKFLLICRFVFFAASVLVLEWELPRDCGARVMTGFCRHPNENHAVLTRSYFGKLY
jgi:hypothetical protein